jgi:hypothetical protein
MRVAGFPAVIHELGIVRHFSLQDRMAEFRNLKNRVELLELGLEIRLPLEIRDEVLWPL